MQSISTVELRREVFLVILGSIFALGSTSPSRSLARITSVQESANLPPYKVQNASEILNDFMQSPRPKRFNLLDKSWNCKQFHWYSFDQPTEYLQDIKIKFTMEDWDVERVILSQTDRPMPSQSGPMPLIRWGNSPDKTNERTKTNKQLYTVARFGLIVSGTEVLKGAGEAVQYFSEFRMRDDGTLIGEFIDSHNQPMGTKAESHETTTHPPRFFWECNAE